MSLKTAPTVWRVDRAYIPKTGKGSNCPGPAQGSKSDHFLSMASSNTNTGPRNCWHPLMGMPYVHSLGKHAWNHMCLTVIHSSHILSALLNPRLVMLVSKSLNDWHSDIRVKNVITYIFLFSLQSGPKGILCFLSRCKFPFGEKKC